MIDSKLLIIYTSLFCYFSVQSLNLPKTYEDNRITHHVIDPKKSDIKFYWKDQRGKIYGNFDALKADLASENKHLVLAMNGGIFQKDRSPLGLYIERGKLLNNLNNNNKFFGNYFLGTKGVFYITYQKESKIVRSTDHLPLKNIEFATQSGPLLVIDGKKDTLFMKNSSNKKIRNGVGILSDGRILFAISEVPINFYDFADYFQKSGCKCALYMDGIISQLYNDKTKTTNNKVPFAILMAVTQKIKSN